MQQHAGVAVDISDLAFGGGSDPKARVKREDAVVLVDGRDIDDVRANCAGPDGEIGLLTGAQIGELELLVCHAPRTLLNDCR